MKTQASKTWENTRKVLRALFRCVALRGGLLLLLTVEMGSTLATSGAASRPAKGTAYVTNQGQADGSGSSVSIIDTETLQVTGSLSLGVDGPLGVAVTNDGNFIYVSESNSNTISVISTKTLENVATIGVGALPGDIAFTPDGKFAYVLSIGSSAVSVIDTRTLSVAGTIDVSTGSLSIAITPRGDFAYVTDLGDRNVSVIDTASNSVVAEIPLAGGPSGIAITPDGEFAFVVDTADVSVIETKTNTVVATIPAGGMGPNVVITPDGELAYVTDYFNGKVSVIDTQARGVIATLAMNTPDVAAVTPDGEFVYIVNNDCFNFPCTSSGTVSVVETATNQVVDTVNVGINSQSIAITPKHKHLQDHRNGSMAGSGGAGSRNQGSEPQAQRKAASPVNAGKHCPMCQ